jgi:hypothetical protein
MAGVCDLRLRASWLGIAKAGLAAGGPKYPADAVPAFADLLLLAYEL